MFYYTYLIYDIENWATDGGRSLNHEEHGCGAMTEWTWHQETPQGYPAVAFNLPLIMATGCVERAIRSAGGPEISCQDMGLNVPDDPFSELGPPNSRST